MTAATSNGKFLPRSLPDVNVPGATQFLRCCVATSGAVAPPDRTTTRSSMLKEPRPPAVVCVAVVPLAIWDDGWVR